MSKTTIKERKSFFHSAIFRNIFIYTLCLLFGFVSAPLGFKTTLSTGGYILIVATVIIYFATGYLIWGSFIPYLDSTKPRKRKQTFYKKAYKLRDSLKKNFLLITLFLVGIVFLTLLTSIVETTNNERLLNIVCAILNGFCAAYIVNVFDALFAYTTI